MFTDGSQIHNGRQYKKREILRGPPFSMLLCSRSIMSKPPDAGAMWTTTRSGVLRSHLEPQCCIGLRGAADGEWMKRDILRASFFSMNCSGSKFFT